MARPRKDSLVPDARFRMIEAFWTLMETNRLQDLTVSMISAEAGCNRGTFYYHYADMDALVTGAIETELLHDNMIPTCVSALISRTDEPIWELFPMKRLSRIRLIIDRGGMDLLASEIKSAVNRLWLTVLRPEGGELSNNTRLILEYVAGGLLGMIAYISRCDQSLEQAFPLVTSFRRDTMLMIVDYISKAEGISVDEILARLKALNNFMFAFSL